MPVTRVTFSEQEAVGIGYYIATNPNPTDSSLLVGSIDEDQFGGARQDEAGRAFRLDGELNIANRGLMEFVEMFKADRHMLTTLLGLAQEQLIKLQKYGSVYADEAIIGHSNEGDFDSFASEQHAEALKDRIIAVQIPYNLRAREEVKIYEKMLRNSTLQSIHMAPLTLRVGAIFTVLSRLAPPSRQGMSAVQKLRLYDGEMVTPYTRQDLVEEQRRHPVEGMTGISPRYVINRLGAVASREDRTCILPLAALDSLWQGMGENISLEDKTLPKYLGLVTDTVKEYNALAIKQIQRAYDESFDETANLLLQSYLANVAAFASGDSGDKSTERDMRELERPIGVTERNKEEFRREIHQLAAAWEKRGWEFVYTSEPRLQAAVEARLFQPRRSIDRGLTQPRFAKQRAEWVRRQGSITNRLKESYGYCEVCAEDLISYVSVVLKNNAVLKTPKNEEVEWLWPLSRVAPDGQVPKA
jgi:serine protein kinase